MFNCERSIMSLHFVIVTTAQELGTQRPNYDGEFCYMNDYGINRQAENQSRLRDK